MSSLRRIATLAGVSAMTVSRVLRNHPHVSLKLAEKVRRVAQGLGYQSDPQIQRLAGYLSQRRKGLAERETLAWISLDSTYRPPASYDGRMLSGAQHRAEHLGFRLEALQADVGRSKEGALRRMLEARGVQGVIFSPPIRATTAHISPSWCRFSIVLTGWAYWKAPYHRALSHHYANALTAMKRLGRLGYQRIGLACSGRSVRRMQDAWLAAFLVMHPQGPGSAVKLFYDLDRSSSGSWQKWLSRQQPDVILTEKSERTDLPCFPKETAFASLHLKPPFLAMGIDSLAEDIGSNAVDLLTAQLHRFEKGPSPRVKTVLTQGTWVQRNT
ncbi:MAG: LacI family transcriptional regulator [Blastochloris sp.]|nr:LacI family transcriptional regulator [Blastochloris sp.]